MKKYNVFYLWVVEKDGHKFICERVSGNYYKEVLTKEDIRLEPNDKVRSLIKYYPILALAIYHNGEILNPLMLTKYDVLLKYIELNAKEKNKDINIDEFLKKQEDELKGWEVLRRECPELAKQLARESLQDLGIIDENENIVGPYRKILERKTDEAIIVDMWETYVDSKKDDMPDIPIISAKELKKKKASDKK